MLELVATGNEAKQRWRRMIPSDETVRLGRGPRHGWAVPWDRMISREHADIVLQSGALRVKRLDVARNPILYGGKPQQEFSISVGEQFQIGATTFLLQSAAQVSDFEPPSAAEESFRRDSLRKFAFTNSQKRLEALSKLPQIIATSTTDEEFAEKLVQLLLTAVPHAEAAAVIVNPDQDQSNVMRWDSRDNESIHFRPSRRMIVESLNRGEGILHIWLNDDAAAGNGNGAEASRYTQNSGMDWAFCTPINEEVCQGWCLYVTGTFQGGLQSDDQLRGELRFTDLLAEFIGSIRKLRTLERRQSRMAKFFSPSVLQSIKDAEMDTDLLPRQTDISVLFCDLRGFSQASEDSAHDLDSLFDQIQSALSVMTREIIKHDGSIADLQGDAALGFWGWPKTMPDGAAPTCLAALAIHSEFRRAAAQPSHKLSGFRVGIGVAHGPAMAGRIGTDEQEKVGVFGPVVNLGSRLEGLTKRLGVSILIDEATARFVDELLPRKRARTRKLALVRPYGMSSNVFVSELLPPADDEDTLSEAHLQQYDAALEAFLEGRWTDAQSQLRELSANDGAADFLLQTIQQRDGVPPNDWDGVIVLEYK